MKRRTGLLLLCAALVGAVAAATHLPRGRGRERRGVDGGKHDSTAWAHIHVDHATLASAAA